MTYPTYFTIVWPERRQVPDFQITAWYLDAVANGDFDPDETTHKEPRNQALALHRAGNITLAAYYGV